MQNNKGQIAIWVILSLVIVGVVLLFFFFRPRNILAGDVIFSPEQYIERCTSDITFEATDLIIPQGGFIEAKDFKIYNDTKVSYLCKNEGSYSPCINQHPVLIGEIEKEVKDYLSPRVEDCITGMKKELEGRGAVVEIDSAPSVITVSLAPRLVFVEISKNIRVTERETLRVFNKFEVKVVNPVYDLARIAMTIAENERKYCSFEYRGYMAIENNVDMRKFVMSDSTKIYSIEDRESGEVFNTAIRGCAIPGGI